MGFTVHNTIFIVGRSEIVAQANLPLISELFTTIGINNIRPDFDPTYTMFVDKGLDVVKNITENNLKTTILTTFSNVKNYTFTTPTKVFDIVFAGSDVTTPYTGKYLHYSGFTHDIAVSFAIKKRFQNVILLGAADFTQRHYDNNTKFKCSDSLKGQSINFLENVCAKHCNLYTVNPASALHIPRITLDDIIQEIYGG